MPDCTITLLVKEVQSRHISERKRERERERERRERERERERKVRKVGGRKKENARVRQAEKTNYTLMTVLFRLG